MLPTPPPASTRIDGIPERTPEDWERGRAQDFERLSRLMDEVDPKSRRVVHWGTRREMCVGDALRRIGSRDVAGFIEAVNEGRRYRREVWTWPGRVPKMTGIQGRPAVPVICDGRTYYGDQKAAEKELGLASGSIGKALRGRIRQSGGHRFRRATPEEIWHGRALT